MPGGLNAASIRQLDEIIECPICLDIYDDPRLLPCGHTYCLRCLQQFCSIDGDRRRRTMLGGCSRVSSCKPSCPICGKEFEVQSSDSSRRSLCDLPKNFSVQKLLLLVSQSTDGGDTQRRRTKACEECSVAADRTSVSGGGKQTASASFYCADCRRKLCRACCSIHGFNDRTAKHKTVPLLCSRLVGGDELDEPGGQRTCENDSTVDDPAKSTGTSQDPSECSLHCSQSSADASATIQLYCHDCRAALCIICFIEGGHSVHRCVHVKDAVGRLRSQLVADVDALDAAAASCHRAAEAVAADRDRFVVDVDGAVERIRQRAEELRQLIDRAADDLCRSLEMARKSKLDRSEQANGNITDRVNAIMTARADAETVLRNGVAGEIVKRADELHDEIGRRIREGIETIDRELGIVKSICVSFTESTMDRFDANKYIGEVDTANSFDGLLISFIF